MEGGRDVPFLQCLRTHCSIVIRQCTGGVVDCGLQVFVSKTNRVRIEVTGRLIGDGRTTDSATTVRPIRPLPDFVQTGSAAAAASARHTPRDARITPFILHYRGLYQDCIEVSKGAPGMFHRGRDRRAEVGLGFLMRGSNPPPHQLGGLGERCELPSGGVRGGAPTAQRLSTIFSAHDGLS